MSDPQVPTTGSNMLDLEEYRKKRTEEGTWPPVNGEHLEFFRRWREEKDK